MEGVGVGQAVVLRGVEAGYGSQRVLHGIVLEVGSGSHVVREENAGR